MSVVFVVLLFVSDFYSFHVLLGLSGMVSTTLCVLDSQPADSQYENGVCVGEVQRHLLAGLENIREPRSDMNDASSSDGSDVDIQCDVNVLQLSNGAAEKALEDGRLLW